MIVLISFDCSSPEGSATVTLALHAGPACRGVYQALLSSERKLANLSDGYAMHRSGDARRLPYKYFA